MTNIQKQKSFECQKTIYLPLKAARNIFVLNKRPTAIPTIGSNYPNSRKTFKYFHDSYSCKSPITSHLTTYLTTIELNA